MMSTPSVRVNTRSRHWRLKYQSSVISWSSPIMYVGTLASARRTRGTPARKRRVYHSKRSRDQNLLSSHFTRWRKKKFTWSRIWSRSGASGPGTTWPSSPGITSPASSLFFRSASVFFSVL